MERMKSILVVFNNKSDNRTLVEQAINLVQSNQTALTVIDAIEESSQRLAKTTLVSTPAESQKPKIPILEEFDSSSLASDVQTQTGALKESAGLSGESAIDILEYVKKEEEHDLQDFVAVLQQAGVPTTSKTVVGVPFIEIIREVIQNRHDLVLMAADGKVGLRETLLGNTSMHLLRKCPCPVWVIKPGQPKVQRRILVALDLVPNDDERTALAQKIMRLATSLARSGQDKLLILHAWSLYGESILRGRAGLPKEVLDNLLTEAKASHRQSLTEFLEETPLEGLNYEVYLLKGDARTLIPEFAHAKAIDLIVMGTVSRTGIVGLFIGNTAEEVLPQVDCSILAVKPDGFVSPVKLSVNENPE